MTEKVRIKVAVAVTALFIGAMSAAGLALNTSHPAVPPAAPVPAAVGGQGTAAAQPVAPISTDHESND